MKRIVILTGSELRHTFIRKFLALSEDIVVIQSYCEGLEKSLRAIVAGQPSTTTLRMNHLANREQSEQDFFGLFVDNTPDYSKPVFLPKGSVNQPPYTDAIIASKPDLLIAYSCSLIKEPLLSAFSGRFLNVHLGLSPYYRGSGTNYWSLVNNEPEYMGTTFMHIDAGIDTGEIIHQIRARIVWGDTPSQIGNRLILDTAHAYRSIITKFDKLERMPALPIPPDAKVYKQKDFSEDSVKKLYANFANGLVESYLANQSERCRKVPIVKNPALETLEPVGPVSNERAMVP
jgi:hypothetical protein